MPLYLLPTPNNGYVERPSKTLAKSCFATEDVLAIPEPHKAIDLKKAERFTKWKVLQMGRVKGVMRWR